MKKKKALFSQDGDLDFQTWLQWGPQKIVAADLTKIELGVRYEYARHSESIRSTIGSLPVNEEESSAISPQDYDILNRIEKVQGRWVWGLRKLSAHLEANRSFSTISREEIDKASRTIERIGSVGMTKPLERPFGLARIKPYSGYSCRATLQKSLHEKEGVELQLGEKEVPVRQFASDGSELWVFAVSPDNLELKPAHAQFKKLEKRYRPPKSRNVSTELRGQQHGSPLQRQTPPSELPTLDSMGGQVVVARVRWAEFNVKEIHSGFEAFAREVGSSKHGMRGRATGAANLRASAKALLAWRLGKHHEETVRGHEAWLRATGMSEKTKTVFESDTGKFTKQLRIAEKDFAQLFALERIERMTVW